MEQQAPPPWHWKSKELEPGEVGTYEFSSPVDQTLDFVEVQARDGELLELLMGVRVVLGMGHRVCTFGNTVLQVGVVLVARVRNNSTTKSLIVVEVHAKPTHAEDQAAVGVWPKCDQKFCEAPSFASYVWPGQGRMHGCIDHFGKMTQAAGALGMTAKSLEVKLTARDPRLQ